MKNYLIFLLLVTTYSCNPDCGTFVSVTSKIDSEWKAADSEVLITTTPLSFLEPEERKIFLQLRDSEEEPFALESPKPPFIPSVGRIVKIPPSVTGDYQLFYEDQDCGGFIPFSTLNVREASYYDNNPNFVTPFPPQIIIPIIQPSPPPAIINAWFSVVQQEYCIWFGPERDTLKDNEGNIVFGNDGELQFSEKNTLIPGDLSTFIPDDTSTFPSEDNPQSFELSALGCGEEASVDDLFHGNPVSGIVNSDQNIIRIQIDRSLKGLGIEEYDGEFVDAGDIPVQYISNSPCRSTDGDETKTRFMLLTSRTTGHQLLLFRGANN